MIFVNGLIHFHFLHVFGNLCALVNAEGRTRAEERKAGAAADVPTKCCWQTAALRSISVRGAHPRPKQNHLCLSLVICFLLQKPPWPGEKEQPKDALLKRGCLEGTPGSATYPHGCQPLISGGSVETAHHGLEGGREQPGSLPTCQAGDHSKRHQDPPGEAPRHRGHSGDPPAALRFSRAGTAPQVLPQRSASSSRP